MKFDLSRRHDFAQYWFFPIIKGDRMDRAAAHFHALSVSPQVANCSFNCGFFANYGINIARIIDKRGVNK